MSHSGFWALYRRYRARFALRDTRTARRFALAGAAVGSLAMVLILHAFGPRTAVMTIGWITLVLAPIAGLDAWRGTMLSGHAAVAWARAAFFCALWLIGLYLALNPGPLAALIER